MSKFRIFVGISILIITPLGFLTKAYHGIGADWVNNSLGGVLYVVFWCLVVAFFKPQWKEKFIAIGVFTVTSLLEAAQLWHPPVLEWLRSFYLGKVLLGTTFALSDFPHYAAGALLGALWIKRLRIFTARPMGVDSNNANALKEKGEF
ncbi:ribosomal maturation YjgA family protein [Caldithrix abyssi]